MSSGLKTLLIFRETGWLIGILISNWLLAIPITRGSNSYGRDKIWQQEPPSQPPSNWSMIWLLESCLQGKKHPQDGWTSKSTPENPSGWDWEAKRIQFVNGEGIGFVGRYEVDDCSDTWLHYSHAILHQL